MLYKGHCVTVEQFVTASAMIVGSILTRGSESNVYFYPDNNAMSPSVSNIFKYIHTGKITGES